MSACGPGCASLDANCSAFSLPQQPGRRAATGSRRPPHQATWASLSPTSPRPTHTRPGSRRTTPWHCSGPGCWPGQLKPPPQAAPGLPPGRSGTGPAMVTHALAPVHPRASPPRRTVHALSPVPASAPHLQHPRSCWSLSLRTLPTQGSTPHTPNLV